MFVNKINFIYRIRIICLQETLKLYTDLILHILVYEKILYIHRSHIRMYLIGNLKSKNLIKVKEIYFARQLAIKIILYIFYTYLAREHKMIPDK